MTIFNWASAASGDWNNAANWTPATVPSDIAADVTIDVPTAVQNGYTVTIASGESITVNTLSLNITNNATAVNTDLHNAAVLEVDGTLTFAPGSAGTIGGPLQSAMGMNGGTIVNVGTINAFLQTQNNVLLTGTNGLYITNWLQAQGGTVTIDTASIAEMTGNTLFDGIFEAASGATINLGGTLQHNIVNIQTVEGPPLIPDGWTELFLDDTATSINEWNGSAYVSIETSLQDIGARGTVDLLRGRNWTTTNTMSIDGGLLNNQGGTFTAAALDINTGIVQGNGVIAAPVANNSTLMVEGGTLTVNGALTGTGTVAFDTDVEAGTIVAGGATAVLGAVSAGQTIVMNGDDTLVLTNPGQFLGHITAGTGDHIAVNGVTVTSAVDNNGTLVLSNGGSVVASLLVNGTLSPDALTVNGTVVTIGTGPVNTGTVTQSDGTVTVADGTTQTVNGSGNTVTAGANTIITIVGASNTVNGGTGGTYSFSGAGQNLNGSNGTVSTATAGSSVTVTGNGNTIDASSAAGSAFGINGTGDLVNASNVTIYAADNAAFTVAGTNDAIGFAGPGAVTTNGNTFYLGGNAAVGISGNGNAVGGSAGTSVTLNGVNNSVFGSGMTINGASGSTVFVAGSADTAYFDGTASIAMSNGTVIATSSSSAISINGNNNVVNDAHAGSVIGIAGTGDLVTASGITLYGNTNTSMTLMGTNDVVGLYTNDRLTIGDASSIAFVTGASGSETIVTANKLQTVYNFDPSAGDRIDLSGILSGVSVTAASLGSYVTASNTANNSTALSIIGPHGDDTVILAGAGSVSLQQLTSQNAFILPA
ncbi:MAG TPA: type I secretion C-terminal target domain-containing protein [Rhodopila sp.]|jgi:hypothetical protein|nr:type I secretion C-terminal target domain-containing protein [Rhodopila sp.]